MKDPISIVVVEDEFFSREGICTLIGKHTHLNIVGQTDNGEDAVQLVENHQPDVLLLDLRLATEMTGLDVIRTLRGKGNTVKIIALTQEKRWIKAVEMEGGNGYIPKDKYQMLVPAIHCVAANQGDVFINPERSESFKKALQRFEDAQLNPQELEVLKLIGYKNEEIARRVFKTVGRVRNMVTDLYFKLDLPQSDKLSQRMQAMQIATILGLLEQPDLDT